MPNTRYAVEDDGVTFKPMNFNQGKYFKAKYRKEHPEWTEDEIYQAVGDKWRADHKDCVRALWHRLKDACIDEVEDMVLFYIGEGRMGQWESRCEEFVADRDTARAKYEHDECLRPWHIHAWDFYSKGKTYRADDNHPEGVVSQATYYKTFHFDVEDCSCAQEEHSLDIRMPLTAVMLLAFDLVDRDTWNLYCEDRRRTQVSHLNGMAGDINPLNYIIEPKSVNLSRKSCHSKARKEKDSDSIWCDVHDVPCFMKGARMLYNYRKMVEQMIRCYNLIPTQGAIDAYNEMDFDTGDDIEWADKGGYFEGFD